MICVPKAITSQTLRGLAVLEPLKKGAKGVLRVTERISEKIRSENTCHYIIIANKHVYKCISL